MQPARVNIPGSGIQGIDITVFISVCVLNHGIVHEIFRGAGRGALADGFVVVQKKNDLGIFCHYVLCIYFCSVVAGNFCIGIGGSEPKGVMYHGKTTHRP